MPSLRSDKMLLLTVCSSFICTNKKKEQMDDCVNSEVESVSSCCVQLSGGLWGLLLLLAWCLADGH